MEVQQPEQAKLGKRNLSHKSAHSENSKEQAMEDPAHLEPSHLTAEERDKEIKQMMKVYRVVDGVAPVDEYVQHRERYRVAQLFGKTYSKILSQSKAEDNKNKFYVLQMLEDKDSKDLYVYFRWGRIGVKGQDAQIPFGKQTGQAIAEFDSKLKEKAEDGNYEELDIVFDDEISPEAQERTMIKDLNKSSLPRKVAELVKDLFSIKIFREHVKEIGYDAQKMPLGKLSSNNLKMGYNFLKLILKELESKDQKGVDAKVEGLTNKFFSFIPHNFGFKKMSDQVINSKEKVTEKLQLLDLLSNMKIAMETIDGARDDSGEGNTIDAYYKRLGSELTPLHESTKEFGIIKDYLQKSVSPSHNFKLELQDMFTVRRKGEDEAFDKNIQNRVLLWYGSRASNFPFILSRGLKVPGAEVPVTGFAFGKGIYFTDCSSKAAEYCHATQSNNTVLLLVCEVALGQSKVLTQRDSSASQLGDSFQSIHGQGKYSHGAPVYYDVQDDGTKIPKGPLQKLNPEPATFLQFNKYVVYKPNQVKLRYLLKCKLAQQ